MANSPGTILAQIWTGLVKDFTAAEAWIEQQVQRAEAVLPASAKPVESDLKQAASDALGAVATGAATYEPALVTGIEGLADAAITTVAGPYAQPLNLMANNAIQDVVDKGTAALKAWALKQQAAFAENAASATAKPAA